MKILRTCNAGILLELDGVSILLDGVCEELAPYLPVPEELRRQLTERFPDALAFTHRHKDHYHEAYAKAYQNATLRLVFKPESPLSGQIGGVKLRGVSTRHIGRVDIPHAGYIIEGSKTVWFTGDASPMSWKRLEGLPRPDVAVITYAYALTEAAWRQVKSWGAAHIVLLHLPDRRNDSHGLWSAVEEVTSGDPALHIPEIGEELEF